MPHGGFRLEEPEGDLSGGELGDGTQGECHLGVLGQRRVAAREEQPQRVRGFDVLIGAGEQVHGLTFLVRPLGFPPYVVEGLVASHLRQPGGWVLRHADTLPVVECGNGCLLQGILGEGEVARETNEGGQDLATLFADRRLDGASHSPPKSMRGRTST